MVSVSRTWQLGHDRTDVLNLATVTPTGYWSFSAALYKGRVPKRKMTVYIPEEEDEEEEEETAPPSQWKKYRGEF